MKLLLDEPETDAIQMVWRGASAISSTSLTVVETRSALGRAHRAGRITARRTAVAKAEAERLLDGIDLIEVEPALVASAADLAEVHGLRACDAVQLASALDLGDAELVVATWDGELRRAVHAEGLTLVD